MLVLGVLRQRLHRRGHLQGDRQADLLLIAQQALGQAQRMHRLGGNAAGEMALRVAGSFKVRTTIPPSCSYRTGSLMFEFPFWEWPFWN